MMVAAQKANILHIVLTVEKDKGGGANDIR